MAHFRVLRTAGSRLAVVAATLALAVVGWAAPAFAHAQLLSTDPPAESVRASSPGSIVLHFGESVEIDLAAIKVYNGDSVLVTSGRTYHPHGDGRAVATKLPKLSDGTYVVTWRVISADSHPVQGAFTFTVSAANAAAAEAGIPGAAAREGSLLAASRGSVALGMVFGAVRFASFGALFVLIGGTAFVDGAWPQGRQQKLVMGLLPLAVFTAIATTIAAVVLEGSYAAGLPLARVVSPGLTLKVLRTRFGELCLVRLVILLAAARPLLSRLRRRGPLPPWWRPAALGTGTAVLLTYGLAGHAGTGPLVALAVPFDLVHLAAAAVWAGGLAVLVAAALDPGLDPDRSWGLGPAVSRYSQWALGAVVAIGCSGGFAAWRQIGSLSALTATTYGRLVVAKTLLFALIVGVATKSRRLVHGHLAVPLRRLSAVGAPGASLVPALDVAPETLAAVAAPGVGLFLRSGMMAAAVVDRVESSSPPGRSPFDATTTRCRKELRRAVLVELVLVGVVMALTASLVNAQPGRQALERSFSAQVHAGRDLLVDVVIRPTRVGPVAIGLDIRSRDGQRVDAADVEAAMSLPGSGVTDLHVPFYRTGSGHFATRGFLVPLRGTWALSVAVRTTNFDEFLAAPIRIQMS